MDMEDAPSSTTMCALRAMRSSNRIQKRGELSALWLSVALRNWTSGRLAGDRGREGVTYCILWGVERSQMDFICLVRCSSGLSLIPLSLCALQPFVIATVNPNFDFDEGVVFTVTAKRLGACTELEPTERVTRNLKRAR